MSPGLLFTYGLVSALLVVNALRSPPLWLPAMITSEAAGFWLWVMPLLAGWALAADALRHPFGQVGLILTAAAWAGQLVVWRRGWTGARAVGTPVPHPGPLIRKATSTAPAVSAPIVRQTLELGAQPHSSDPLKMDVYRSREVDGAQPLIVYSHGGGWRGGNPRQAGQALVHHLARSGWTVAAIEYPLSPAATFPEHLLGIDLALAWARDESLTEGPVVLMGGSAGAHLSAVAALTRQHVSALVGLYGIYDLLNRNHTRHNWPLIPRMVMKTTPREDPQAYMRASPLDLVNGSAPPSLLIAGSYDSLVPPAETHHFADRLREHNADVTVLEVPWAQHGFDSMAGPRTRAVAGAIDRWLASRLSGHAEQPGIRRQ